MIMSERTRLRLWPAEIGHQNIIWGLVWIVWIVLQLHFKYSLFSSSSLPLLPFATCRISISDKKKEINRRKLWYPQSMCVAFTLSLHWHLSFWLFSYVLLDTFALCCHYHCCQSVSHIQNWHEEVYNMIFSHLFVVFLWFSGVGIWPLFFFLSKCSWKLLCVLIHCSICFSIRNVSSYPHFARSFELQRLPCACLCMCVGVARFSSALSFFLSRQTRMYVFL